jgi:hypothetical protein
MKCSKNCYLIRGREKRAGRVVEGVKLVKIPGI